jgi:hypothetical protein
VFRTARRAALALVFAGLGFAALGRGDTTQRPLGGDGWVDLSFDP